MGKVYAVATGKGGVGKTTLAVHLAASLLEVGGVELLDADPQQSASTWARRALPAMALRVVRNRDELLEGAADAAERGDVVLDVAGVQSDLLLAACLVADVVVLPCGPSTLDLDALAATARAISNARRVRRHELRAIAVLNRADGRQLVVRDAVRVIVEQIGLPLARSIVPQRVAIADAPGQGGLAMAELRDVVRDILEHRTHEQTQAHQSHPGS
jgi:chromosome partitioning protein